MRTGNGGVGVEGVGVRGGVVGGLYRIEAAEKLSLLCLHSFPDSTLSVTHGSVKQEFHNQDPAAWPKVIHSVN